MSALPLDAPPHEVAALLKARKPGCSLPAGFYSSATVYAADLERVFGRCWILAGHVSQIPNSGDFFVYELGPESIIVVRDDAGDVRAHANVCRHRGSRICLEAKGHARALVCPYHGWTYGMDGVLRSRRAMPESFEVSNVRLRSVQLEVFHGLLFISLGDAPEPFDASALDGPMAAFDLANAQVAAERSYTVGANWKLAIENYHECYHCVTAHPEYSRIHSLRAPDAESADLRAAMEMRASGIDQSTVETQAPRWMEHYYGRHPLYPGYVTGTEDGEPAAPLMGEVREYDLGATDITIASLSFLLAYNDHVVSYTFVPTAVQETRMDLKWYVRGDAVAGRDYDEDRLVWLWDVTSAADKRIILNNQLGVNSRYYEPGPFSEMEDYVQKFVSWYCGALER